jgi:hypothetical protein
MKLIISTILSCILILPAFSQDFEKAISTAQTAYAAGKLEEAHFALQQAMQEVDLIIGKEVLKLLPPKMDSLAVNSKDDQVTSNIGFVGATIHRVYGKNTQKADLSIISNSPLVATMNTLLNTPFLGGMMSDGSSKNVKVQGYKARLEKLSGSDDTKNDYQLQIPLGSALVTFKVDDTNETQIMNMANSLPMQQIAKLIQ